MKAESLGPVPLLVKSDGPQADGRRFSAAIQGKNRQQATLYCGYLARSGCIVRFHFLGHPMAV